MKSKVAVFVVAAALSAPMASLWASAGDATQPGAVGTTTPQSTTKKSGHKHHHHKKTPAPAATSTPTTK